MAAELVEVMVKHLPPSGATLRLLDVEGRCEIVFRQHRLDLDIVKIDGAVADWQLAPLSFDAIAAFYYRPSPDFLGAALAALRPGGRLIVMQPDTKADEDQVVLLETAGYARILVEQTGTDLLLRGEKPHTETRTLDRVQQVASRDMVTTLNDYRGRYVHLLIRQSPNKPVWALQPDEMIEWQAVAVRRDDETYLLAFSSLPKAVAFMQPAVINGVIDGVNKVGKFSRETAQTWPLPVLFNPPLETIAGSEIVLWSVDPDTAEAPR